MSPHPPPPPWCFPCLSPQALCLPLCLEAAWGAASWPELPGHPSRLQGPIPAALGHTSGIVPVPSVQRVAGSARGGSGSPLAGGPAGVCWQPPGEGIFSSPLPLAVGGVWHLFVVEVFGVWVAGGTSPGTKLTRAQGTLLTPKSLDVGVVPWDFPLILSPGLCPGQREAA